MRNQESGAKEWTQPSMHTGLYCMRMVGLDNLVSSFQPCDSMTGSHTDVSSESCNHGKRRPEHSAFKTSFT